MLKLCQNWPDHQCLSSYRGQTIWARKNPQAVMEAYGPLVSSKILTPKKYSRHVGKNAQKRQKMQKLAKKWPTFGFCGFSRGRSLWGYFLHKRWIKVEDPTVDWSDFQKNLWVRNVADFLSKKGVIFWFFAKIRQTVKNTGKWWNRFLKSLARPFTKKIFLKIRRQTAEKFNVEKTDLLR